MRTSQTIQFLIVVAGGLATACNAEAQTTTYVDATNCPGPGSGTPADPYCSIQTAIDASANGDEIVVAPGTYFETINFSGKAITVRSSAGPDVTFIDATGLDDSVVKCVSGEGPDAVLDGFTITGGFVSGNGGGMRNEGSSPTVRNCVLFGNTATLHGGGMFNGSNSEPTVVNCIFSDNTTIEHGAGPWGGGGMYNDDSRPTVINCVFAHNTPADNGGGMYNLASDPTLINCAFVGNQTGDGAGMNNNDSSPTLINCTFFGNRAEGGSANGGGMRNHNDSMPTVTSCIFWGNSDDGGTDESGQILDVTGSATAVSYSCIQDCTTFCANPANHNTGDDPFFADAAGPDNIPGTEDDDLHLRPGSPCIDAGDNMAVPPDLADLDGDGDTGERTPLDLDANPRFVDDPGTTNTGLPDPPDYPEIVDMGAYEFQAPTTEAQIDIKPGSCPNSFNRNSHGVLPVALLGIDGFDVGEVDLSSVTIWRADGVGGSVGPNEGPPGPHSEFEDVGTPFDGELCNCHEATTDGVTDLSMKFRTDDLVAALELDGLAAGALVELTVSGELLDGTPFEASDCVRLVPPGTPPGQLRISTEATQRWTDVQPLDLTLDGGGFGTFTRVYPMGSVVTLEAPASTVTGKVFDAWVIDGIRQPIGQRTIQIAVASTSHDLTSYYKYPQVISGPPRRQTTGVSDGF